MSPKWKSYKAGPNVNTNYHTTPETTFRENLIYVCGGRMMATWWSSNFDRLGKLWCRSSFWCMRMIVADALIFVSRKHKMKYISTLSHPAPLLNALAQVLLQRTPRNLAIIVTIYHHYKFMILHVLSTFISWFCRVFFFPRSGWSAAFIAERLCHGFLATNWVL